MRKLLYLTIMIFCFAAKSFAAGPAPYKFSVTPSAVFDKIWIEYDITENTTKGLKIHLKFTAYGMKEMDAFVAVYFEYNDEIGGFVKDKNKKMHSTAGDVALYNAIKPAYDPAVYSDLQLFMPYNELDLEPGEFDLTMDIKVIYKAGGIISPLTKHNFEYSKPGSPTINTDTWVNAIFENLWVDYDITENGQTGMRVHVKCKLVELKDIDCYLALYFEKKNGEKIIGTKPEFRSKSGQLAAYKTLKPAYAEAVYKDLQIFIPYSEFNLSKGRHDLKLSADIIYKNGDLIKHLKTHDFWFEK